MILSFSDIRFGCTICSKELISIAKNSGCDAVKFQKRDINLVYTKEELDDRLKNDDLEDGDIVYRIAETYGVKKISTLIEV